MSRFPELSRSRLTLLGAVLNHFAGLWVFASMAANENVPAYYVTFTYDWRDFAAVGFCAVAAGFLAGLVPALRAAGGDVQAALRDGDKGSGGFFARISKALVVGEIALTVVLLAESTACSISTSARAPTPPRC